MIRTLGMPAGLPRGNPGPLAHELVHERVVVGQAHQLPVAQAIRAAVADMGDRDLVASST